MIEVLSMLSLLLLIAAVFFSVFSVMGVFINKFQGNSSKQTYPKWRVLLLYTGILLGYVSGAIQEFLMFEEGSSSLKNFTIVCFFYVASAIVLSFLTFKESVGEDENGQEIDYRSVQFFLIVIVGFLSILLLSY